MKKAKKVLTLVACAVLLVCISVGATLAYLQATTAPVQNTFSVGAVGATLDEAEVDVFGNPIVDSKKNETDEKETLEETLEQSEYLDPRVDRVTSNTYKLVPGEDYVKDPTVHLTAETEPVYVFVQVINEITAIEAGNAADATDEQKATTIAAQMATNGWKALGAAYPNIYVYENIVHTLTDGKLEDGSTAVAKGELPVFTTFTLGDKAEITASYAEASIDVKAFIIQANGFANAEAAWNAGQFELITEDASTNEPTDDPADEPTDDTTGA